MTVTWDAGNQEAVQPLTPVTHWLPQDPAVSTITACGLDIDKVKCWWSRVRLPFGLQHGCPTCREAATVTLDPPDAMNQHTV